MAVQELLELARLEYFEFKAAANARFVVELLKNAALGLIARLLKADRLLERCCRVGVSG